VRPLAPIEIVFIAAVGGSVLAVMIPAFVHNVHASRLAEPVDGLARIAVRATALAAGRPVAYAYPPSVGLTPSRVPAGQRETDLPGTWDNPTWSSLDFRFTNPHAFSFIFESKNGSAGAEFEAQAHGDLDGDGSLSSFSLGGNVQRGGEPEVGSLSVYREVE
jgi:hypothetical protein